MLLEDNENHPVWDAIEKYEEYFGDEYLIGTMVIADMTGDKLLPILEKAIKTNTPIEYGDPLIYGDLLELLADGCLV